MLFFVCMVILNHTSNDKILRALTKNVVLRFCVASYQQLWKLLISAQGVTQGFIYLCFFKCCSLFQLSQRRKYQNSSPVYFSCRMVGYPLFGYIAFYYFLPLRFWIVQILTAEKVLCLLFSVVQPWAPAYGRILHQYYTKLKCSSWVSNLLACLGCTECKEIVLGAP